MRRAVLVDTGPLVAFLNARDRYHVWAGTRLGDVEPPLLTCEAVISEACFLLGHARGGAEALLELVRRGLVAIPFRLADEAPRIRELLGRYANVPMSLADACLVRLAELHPESPLLTLDGDFRIYRMHRRSEIPTIMPG